jgi:hypothetical protein
MSTEQQKSQQHGNTRQENPESERRDPANPQRDPKQNSQKDPANPNKQHEKFAPGRNSEQAR